MFSHLKSLSTRPRWPFVPVSGSNLRLLNVAFLPFPTFECINNHTRNMPPRRSARQALKDAQADAADSTPSAVTVTPVPASKRSSKKKTADTSDANDAEAPAKPPRSSKRKTTKADVDASEDKSQAVPSSTGAACGSSKPKSKRARSGDSETEKPKSKKAKIDNDQKDDTSKMVSICTVLFVFS